MFAVHVFLSSAEHKHIIFWSMLVTKQLQILIDFCYDVQLGNLSHSCATVSRTPFPKIPVPMNWLFHIRRTIIAAHKHTHIAVYCFAVCVHFWAFSCLPCLVLPYFACVFSTLDCLIVFVVVCCLPWPLPAFGFLFCLVLNTVVCWCWTLPVFTTNCF